MSSPYLPAAPVRPSSPEGAGFFQAMPLDELSVSHEPALVRRAVLAPGAPQVHVEVPPGQNVVQATSLRSRNLRTGQRNVSAGRVIADASAFRGMSSSPAPVAQPKRGPDENPRYVLPVDPEHVTEARLTKPHHDYAAWDLGIPIGTDLYSVTAGHVTAVISGARCGIGVQVAGNDGFTYLYCHGSETIARLGADVEPGDLIMLSGNTGRSTGPHLHLQMRSPAGALVCPQDLLPAWAEGDDISPAEASEEGCFYRGAGHGSGSEGDDDEHSAADKVATANKKRKKGGNKKSKGHSSAPPKATPAPGAGPKPSPKPKPTPTPSPSGPPEEPEGAIEDETLEAETAAADQSV